MLIVKITKAKKKAKQQTDFVGLYLYYRCKCGRQNNKGSEENREKNPNILTTVKFLLIKTSHSETEKTSSKAKDLYLMHMI